MAAACATLALALGACMETENTQETVTAERSETLTKAFINGCLNPERSMRTALRSFAANGLSYREPFTQDLSPSGRRHGGQVRLASGVPSPERGDKNWDTRLLGCEVSRIGVIATDVHATILQGLSQKGFKAVKTLPAITSQTTASTAGIYTRNGVWYSIKLIQVLAKNPKNRGGGDYLYIRGNSYTTISLQSLSEPIGYTLP